MVDPRVMGETKSWLEERGGYSREGQRQVRRPRAHSHQLYVIRLMSTRTAQEEKEKLYKKNFGSKRSVNVVSF